MPRPRRDVRDAIEHIARADAHFAAAIAAGGICDLPTRRPARSDFAALTRSIVFQQLAGKAASAIHGRFLGLFPGGDVTAASVLSIPEGALRKVGLSGNKAASIRDLAVKVDDGTVRLEGVGRRSDEQVVTELTRVRGIGRWTAEMFLMFQLGRLDVWPVDDFGVQQGYRRIQHLEEVPRRREFDAAADPFRPYRSVAAWYCWRSADG